MSTQPALISSPSCPPRYTPAAHLKGRLDFRVLSLGRCRGGREEVGQERQEERHVLRYELAEVHVPKRPVHEERLRLVGVVALGLARRT